jgi:hypothetical protein
MVLYLLTPSRIRRYSILTLCVPYPAEGAPTAQECTLKHGAHRISEQESAW